MTAAEAPPRARRSAWLLLAALLVSYAYFYQAGGWNQNSRFALVRALVERGTIRIDAYHAATGDKAFFRGHFYSDKAPGQAFAAAPVVAALRPMLRGAGVEPDSAPGLAWLAYAATLATAALPMALAALALARVAARLGASPAGGRFAALVLGLGTPAWAYATLFIGHCLAGALLMLAFVSALALADAPPGRGRLRWALALGAAGGAAGLVEYPAGPAAGLVALFALLLLRSDGRAELARAAAGIGVGASVFAAALLAYHEAAFDSPFALPLEHLAVVHAGEPQFALPRAGTAWSLLFGRARGIFALAPVLLAAPAGFVLAWRAPGGNARTRRLAIALCALLVVYYVLLTASFVNPGGGWTWGPRLLSASLPFLCLGLAFAWTRASVRWRLGLAGLALCGAALAFVAVSTNVQPPEDLPRPMSQLLWPSFRAGRLSQLTYSIAGASSPPGRAPGFVGRGAWNLGQLLGLRGHASLAPLALAWLGLAALAWRLQRRPQPAREGEAHRGR